MGDFNSAKSYNQTALAICQKFNNKHDEAMALNNLGSNYIHTEELNKALEYLNKALVIRDSLDEKSGIASTLKLMGLVYEHNQEYERSIDYYFQALKIAEELEDKRAIAEIFTLIGENLLKIGNPDDALDYFDQSLDIAEDIGAKREVMNNYEQLALLHANNKSFEKAATYIEKYSSLKDSLSIDLEEIEQPEDDGSDKLRVYQLALTISAVIILFLIILMFVKRSNKKQ
jgi:tetratricopeptide (TPR) repeat protein